MRGLDPAWCPISALPVPVTHSRAFGAPALLPRFLHANGADRPISECMDDAVHDAQYLLVIAVCQIVCYPFPAMSTKPDYRNYINPPPKGARITAQWQEEMLPDGETYTEDKTGTVIDALIRSVRPGSIVRVRRAFCLAPWRGSPKKRREALAARVDAIVARGGCFMEAETGLSTGKRGECARILMSAYEDIATAGRAVARGRTGRPPIYQFTKAEWEIIEGIWTSRRYKNDGERLAVIKKRLGRAPGRTLVRNKIGSPHKGRDQS